MGQLVLPSSPTPVACTCKVIVRVDAVALLPDLRVGRHDLNKAPAQVVPSYSNSGGNGSNAAAKRSGRPSWRLDEHPLRMAFREGEDSVYRMLQGTAFDNQSVKGMITAYEACWLNSGYTTAPARS